MRKRCPKCGRRRESKEFYTNISRVDGFSQYCRLCTADYNSSTKVLKRRREWGVKDRQKDPRKAMFSEAKSRAKHKGVPFEIQVEDILIPTICPILGIPLKVHVGRYEHDSPTLDEVTPKRGYVVGNIAVISHRANRIKNDSSLDDLEAIIRYVKRFNGVIYGDSQSV